MGFAYLLIVKQNYDNLLKENGVETMDAKKKLELIEEIKRIERELYLKKSKLASIEAMEYDTTLPSLVGNELNSEEWQKTISKLIRLIGQSSIGGDSVEDVRKEREK